MIAMIALSLIALCVVSAGLFAVRSTNLVHSVLWLAVSLAGTSALYLMVGASFLSAIQIILYTGGVITLMLFGVMLTDRNETTKIGNPSERKRLGAVSALAVFALIASAVSSMSFTGGGSTIVHTKAIGQALLTEHLLAFEALSILLLAAMLAAIVVARRRDP
ncbi:MAG: NADH-quinone oxidoreductase subunit J [Myxococcales bacterium]|nr:NADH-quinone oxidoreductase subunit J [Myxococcales bacterium]